MSNLTKKDYIKFADSLASMKMVEELDNDTLIIVEKQMIKIFKADNESFDEQKFRDYITGEMAKIEESLERMREIEASRTEGR